MKPKVVPMKNEQVVAEMCRCGKPVEFDYYNKVSGYREFLCRRCLENLRHDVSADEWIKLGFAEPIFKRFRVLGEEGLSRHG